MNGFSKISFLLICLLPLRIQGVNVMVNEYRNGSGTIGPGSKMAQDEFIEFVIVENATASELASLSFGDSNDATSMLQGVFRFDQATLESALSASSLSSFKAGSLIVVKGSSLGPQNLSYNPLSSNIADSDAWSIELLAGQGALDHPESLINGNISIGNNGDVAWISSSDPPVRNTDTSGFLHAIGHDSAPGTIANDVMSRFGNENILSSTVGAGRSVSNLGDTTELLAAVTTGTMAEANGGTNSTWIDGLRSAATPTVAPEPGRAVLMLGGLFMMVFRRTRTRGQAHVC